MCKSNCFEGLVCSLNLAQEEDEGAEQSGESELELEPEGQQENRVSGLFSTERHCI